MRRRGLCGRLQRAIVSISSNIAEGTARSSNADFVHFMDFALGSVFEVETLLTIAKNVGNIDNLGEDLILDANLKFQNLMERIH